MRRSIACKHFQRPSFPDDVTVGGADIMLEKATVSVQNDRPVAATYESLYNSVADLLQPKFAKSLCQKLEQLIDQHTRSVLEQFKQNDLEQMHFLRQINDCWRNNCRQLYQIRGIFLYLDRKYVLSDTSTLSIWDLGIEKFRHYFTENIIIQKRTVEDLLNLVEQERRGQVIDRQLVKDLLKMLSSLSLYQQLFEPRFFEETKRLYLAEGLRLVNEREVPDYLRYISKIIAEETERANFYLETITHVPLIEIVERELIAVHLELMLTKGLDQLLDDLRKDELKLLHSLVSRVSTGLQELCSHFNKHIKQRVQVIVTDKERDKTMVQDLLSFKERMDVVVEDCFGNQERFIYSLKEAFEYSINKRPNKPAELIAKYIDSKLRSANKEFTEDQMEKKLDQILVLFRFIHGKDVFEAFYKKDLAKRLLFKKSASVDAEKSMLAKLEAECGAGFTSKLKGMFRDIDHSEELMTNLKNHLAGHSKLNEHVTVDMAVNVLTAVFWPTYQPVEVNMPKDLLKHQEIYEKFYVTTQHSGRNLQWQPNLGQMAIIAECPNSQFKKHELIVSEFQGLVLLMFNDSDEFSFEEILEHTKIETEELKRTLQSLACGKWRILLKRPQGKEVNAGDKFMYNSKFTAPLHHLKINQVQLRETQEEQSMTEERVFQDRQYQIDAAIVRIMKTRKKLAHNALIMEVIEHLRFPVRGHDIKVRIESLIERDYLHRDQDNSTIYNYVA